MASRLLRSEWLWLAALVCASAAIRYAFARGMASPWILVDEIIYSESAKGVAEDGRRAVRGIPIGNQYGAVYPLLLSPAYALFDAMPDVYEAMKVINAVTISLVAVPTYLIGRRVLPARWALLGAALALTPPTLLYAGTIMTENAFYPAFMLAALALVRALERPSWARSLVLAAVIALAFLVRAQAVALVPAALSAPVLLAAWDGGGRRALWAYRRLYAVFAAGGLLALLAYTLRGESPRAALGAYASVLDSGYSAREIARWTLYHVAELDLAVGVAPLAGLLLLVAVASGRPREVQAFAAAAVALSVWLLLQVAAFASLPSVLRVEERNLFHVEPLLFLSLLVWIRLGAPRPPIRALAVTGAVALLPLALPFERLINVSAVSDTFGLLPWWDVHDAGVALADLHVVAAVTAALVAALVLVLPRAWTTLLPFVVLAFLAVSHDAVASRLEAASSGALWEGTGGESRDWIDRRVRGSGEVVVLWSGRGGVDERLVFSNEFFNRRVGRVFNLGVPTPGSLPEVSLSSDAAGVLRDINGAAVRAPFALTDASVKLRGRIVARDRRPGRAVLFRLRGPLGLAETVDGVHPDGWSGPTAVYTRFACRGGSVLVTAESDAQLFREPQTVDVVSGRRRQRFRVAPGRPGRAVVPLTAQEGRCVAALTVTPTAVPRDVVQQAVDDRVLGTRFGFTYRP